VFKIYIVSLTLPTPVHLEPTPTLVQVVSGVEKGMRGNSLSAYLPLATITLPPLPKTRTLRMKFNGAEITSKASPPPREDVRPPPRASAYNCLSRIAPECISQAPTTSVPAPTYLQIQVFVMAPFEVLLGWSFDATNCSEISTYGGRNGFQSARVTSFALGLEERSVKRYPDAWTSSHQAQTAVSRSI